MAKRSQLDRAIDALKADRAVLDLAIAKLEAQISKAVRKPKAKPTAAQTDS